MSQKTIIITGASKSSGIGLNAAKPLLEKGHRVIATVRNLEKNDLLTEGLDKQPNLYIKHLDLMDEKSISEFAQACLDEFGNIDVLVNSAANVYVGPVEGVTDNAMHTTFQTKVFGPVALIQAFLPHWRERRQGVVINLSSIFSPFQTTVPGLGVYLAAIVAMERIYDSLAIELKPWNIHFVNYQPGPVDTELARVEDYRFTPEEDPYQGYVEQAYDYFKPIGWQPPQEVGAVVADIALEDNPHHCYQSNKTTEDFVRQDRQDITGDSYINDIIEHFKKVGRDTDSKWKIK